MLTSKLDLTKIRLTVNVLLGALCLVLVWLLVDRAFLSQIQTGLTPEPLQPLPSTLRLNWFQATSAPVAVEVVALDKELTDASIRAELLGVIITSQFAFAAIQTPQVADGLYQVGDEIAANIELLKIEPNRVIVRERGAERQIRLAPVSDDGAANTLSLLQPVQEEKAQGFNLAGVFGSTPITLPEGSLAMRIDSLDQEFAELSGLQVSDILVSIDGHPMADFLSNPAMLQQIFQQTLVNVSLQRGGETLQLSLNARSLSERILPKLGQGLVQ